MQFINASSLQQKLLDKQSILLTIVSNKYVKAYYSRQAQGCPSLEKLEPTASLRVAKYYLDSTMYAARRVLIILTIIIAFVLINPSSAATWSSAGFFFIVEIASLFWFFRWSRLHSEGRAADMLFFTICQLERSPSQWESSGYRWDIAKRLERTAIAIEHIPLALRSVAPSVRREVFRASSAKAQAIRELEMWAIRPGPFTFTDLIEQLANDLSTIVNGRWYDLPEVVKLEHETSRWRTAVWLIAAIGTFGAGVTLAVLSAKIDAALYVPAGVLFGVGAVSLNKAGISAQVSGQFTGIGSK